MAPRRKEGKPMGLQEQLLRIYGEENSDGVGRRTTWDKPMSSAEFDERLNQKYERKNKK
jgi:hypothetical protein